MQDYVNTIMRRLIINNIYFGSYMSYRIITVPVMSLVYIQHAGTMIVPSIFINTPLVFWKIRELHKTEYINLKPPKLFLASEGSPMPDAKKARQKQDASASPHFGHSGARHVHASSKEH